MTTGADISKALDGPAGWAVVLIVGAVIIYVALDKVGTAVGNADNAVQNEVQSFNCWFNNSCVVADTWSWITS
jgi:hypothetical protein